MMNPGQENNIYLDIYFNYLKQSFFKVGCTAVTAKNLFLVYYKQHEYPEM